MGAGTGDIATLALHSNAAVFNGQLTAGGLNSWVVSTSAVTLRVHEPEQAMLLSSDAFAPWLAPPGYLLTYNTGDAALIDAHGYNAVILDGTTAYKLLPANNDGSTITFLNASASTAAEVDVRDAADTTTLRTISVPAGTTKQLAWYGARWFAVSSSP